MKNTSLFRRILSVALVIAMLASVLVPASAAEAKKVTSQTKELELVPIDSGTLDSRKQEAPAKDSNENEAYRANDVVRVSIVLAKASTLDAGYKLDTYTKNAAAKAYRESLRQDQKAMTAKIEKVIGSKLDVKWNLTLAANNISANVRYGDIEAIKAIEGVKDVFLENRYEPQVDEHVDEPNNGSASYMIGSNITWANGYVGAGSKVAIIDTGADIDHQSFSGEGLEYALAQTAEEKGMSYDEYVESLNLLTADKIEAVKGELNANIGSGAAAYRNTKVGYGYNYVDKNVTNITHTTDTQGEHGSHVSGIATGNRFIKVDGEYVPALTAVGTQGVAPDAQLVVMKVFGSGGGAYDSDYMVAIEDAIVLGCDSANLSLGSGSAGFSFSNGYESVMNKLVENGTVVAFSAGNSGMWYDTPNNPAMQYPYLYVDDVNYATNGSPGSFTNALTVASVDNMGQTGYPLLFGDRHVFYSETSGYGNEPISTIAGQEYEYVLLDNAGVDDNDHVGGEGDFFLELGPDVLTGKVAMCYRGSSSFFAKANAAVAQGAIAVVIINNTTGVINMNLTGYSYTAPCVSILKADGDAIKADSEQVTTEDGKVYYTGTMSVAAELEVQVPEVSDTVTVSSFSSWGGPGSLVLKPEILTPGGSIYSVWGANIGQSSPTDSHEDYEVMSGTSMASPQVAGMAAVMGQYIRDNDLCAKTGKTARQLINSLLMSTAHPVYDSDGNYWPVMRVGSGLGNIADATAAKSFIMMDEDATMFPDSAKDGKVKVELGDDPDYTGEYDFSFTVYPLEDAKEFTLRTDIFTQWIAGNGGYGLLQDTATTLLGSEASYEVNGETYEDYYPFEADVNMDGETNAADAQAILDKVTGKLGEEEPFDANAADIDGDGKITSYDAKQLLDSAATPAISITEPTKVTVHVKIDEGDRDLLLRYFTGGFFVEGYTYVEPVADEEGTMDVVHSIPIYGFCGSWTGPAMLDRSSAIDVAYGTAKQPYVVNAKNSNYLSIKNPEGDATIYMGNPYMIEDTFPADRLAMNSEATINAYQYLNIRNIATLGFAVQDEEGNILYAQATPIQKFSAYYYVNGGTWQNTTPSNFNVGKKLSQAGVQEGDVVTVGFYALPEYYGILNAKNNGEVATTGSLDTEGFKAILESGIVGDGAAIKYTVKIDNQAPEVKGALMDLISGDIYVKASDDNYIAYVGVLNKAGTVEYLGVVPEQTEPGEEVEVPLVFEEGTKIPNEVVLLVGDYAGNECAFKVSLGGSSDDEEDPYAGAMFGFVPGTSTVKPGDGNRVWQIDPEKLSYNYNSGSFSSPKGLTLHGKTDFTVTAAEYLEGYVFMAADDGWIYVAPLDGMDEVSRVGRYDEMTGYIYDMAFNYQNKRLYAMGENNTVYRIDPITGVMKEVAVVTLPGATGEANRLAIDDNGVFYTANYGGPSTAKLYKFTLEGEAIEPEEPIEGDVAYSWDFEDGADDWTFVDADGDGYNWFHHVNTGSGNYTTHSGDAVIASESYHNSETGSGGTVLTPDNWAISPAFDLSEAGTATLSIWAVGQDSSYASEVFALYAGTSAVPSEMTKVAGDFTATGSYVNYTASLEDFLGEDEVYIAIRHYNVSDMFILNVDDVEIVIAEPDEGDAIGSLEINGTRSGKVTAAPVETRDASENAFWSCGFEDSDELSEWSIIDADGDGNSWLYYEDDPDDDYENQAYEGSCDLVSQSYINGTGALTPDNWLITPAIDLSGLETGTFSFYAKGRDPSYAAEHFAAYICVGEPEDTTDFVEILPETEATGAWTQYTADLSNYLGEEEVYFAIRHFNCTDMFIFDVDLVEVLTDDDIPEPIEPEPEPEPEEPVLQIEAAVVGSGLGVYNYSNGGSMAWDHDNDILYLASNYNATQDYDHYLWIVDTETGVAARANEVGGTGNNSSNPSARLAASVRGLFIVPDNSPLIHPVDEPTGIEVVPAELNIFKGQIAQLDVVVFPWTLREKEVTWASADESIATVKDGKVTGVEVGETTIIVTTVAEPILTVEVPVTVTVPPEAEIRGIIWDENGKGQASVFNSNAPEEWTALSVVGQLRWGAHIGDKVYGSTDDTMYVFDADTYEVTQLGGIVSMWIPSDAAELPQDFRDAFAEMGYNVGPVIGPNNNGTYLTMLDPEAGSLIYFDLADWFSADPMATFAYVGRGEYDDGESVDDNAAVFYCVTESGELYRMPMSHEGSVMREDLGNIGIDLTGVADATNNVWASMVYDPEVNFLYLSLYNGDDEFAHLYAIDPEDPGRVGETGNFNADVWPVTGLYQYEPLTDLTMTVSPEELVLFEGETKELKIKIKLGETNEYVAEIADESIATFADGAVTGVKEGETLLTITTVDVNEAGEHLTAEIPVKVKGLKSVEGFVTAQVTDEHGTRFTKISLDGAVVSKKGIDAPGNVTTGGRGGSIYVADVDGNLNILDAETYEPISGWNAFDMSMYPEYPALDLANYPTFLKTNGKADESKFLMTLDVGYLVTPNYMGWNLTSFIPDMSAVAFAGVSETQDEDGATVLLYNYYILGADGTLYYMGVDFVGGRRTDVQAVLDTGIVLADKTDASMTVLVTAKVNGDDTVEYDNAGLVIADNGSKKLWFIDFMTEDPDDVVGLIGVMDVENVSGLAATYDELDSVADMQDIEPWTPPEGLIAGWYFEDTNEVADWTMLDNDNDSYTWSVVTGSYTCYEGEGLLRSRYNGSTNVDNWAITPAIDLSEVEGAELTFWVSEYSSSWGDEHYAVYAGTSPNPEEMVEIVPEAVATTSWQNVVVDLSDFVGESEVYVAFRHFNCSDTFYMFLDQVEIFEKVPEVLEDGYYLIHDGWTLENVNAEEIFVENEENPGEYMLTTTLTEGDKIKVVKVEGNEITGWYPDGEDNEYNVYADHAGAVNIYFKPDGSGNGDWHYGYFFVEVVPVEPGLTFPVLWTFDSADDVADWTMLDLDGNGNTFAVESGALKSKWASPTVDNWAITPAIDLTNAENPEVSIDVRKSSDGWDEHFAIYAGTSNDPEQMVEILGDTEPTATYESYVASLADFAGEATVYVALRHFNSPDQYCLYADNFDVREGAAEDPGSFAFIPMKAVAEKTGKLGDGEARLDTALIDTSVEMTKVGETANAVVGGTNRFTGLTFKPVDNTLVAEGEVTIELTEDEAVTNGLVEVTYDPEILTYVDTLSELEYFSVNENEGVITFAYAALEEIPAETVLAKLTFTYEGEEVDTEVTVKTLERSDDVAVEEDDLVIPVKVEKPACEHEYGEPVWAWADDFSAATATFTCALCEDVQVLDAEISVEYLEDKTVYTATVVFNEETYTDVKEGPAAEIFELVDVLKDGDKVVIYNPMAGMAVTNKDLSEAQPTYRAGFAVTPKDEKITTNETSIIWTVVAVEGGVQFVDADGHKLSMDNKGLELDKANDVWEIRSLNETDKTVAIVNVNAAPGSSGDPKALEWYTKFSEFSTHYLNTEDGQFIFELYAISEGEEEHDCKIAHFTDVMEAYPYGTPEHEAIEWAFTADPQVTAGTSETTFGVGKAVRRGDAMFYLWVAAGKPEPTLTESPFTDVTDPSAYYYKAILWAYENGITSGVSATEFGRKRSVSRRDMLVFLYTQQGKPAITLTESPYTDVTDSSAYYYKAVLWAYENGIEKGADGAFNGKADCLRETVVLWMYRTLQGKALAE